jgi:hypothetical protein
MGANLGFLGPAPPKRLVHDLPLELLRCDERHSDPTGNVVSLHSTEGHRSICGGAYAQRATLFPMRAPRHGGRARDLPIRFLADVI